MNRHNQTKSKVIKQSNQQMINHILESEGNVSSLRNVGQFMRTANPYYTSEKLMRGTTPQHGNGRNRNKTTTKEEEDELNNHDQFYDDQLLQEEKQTTNNNNMNKKNRYPILPPSSSQALSTIPAPNTHPEYWRVHKPVGSITNIVKFDRKNLTPFSLGDDDTTSNNIFDQQLQQKEDEVGEMQQMSDELTSSYDQFPLHQTSSSSASIHVPQSTICSSNSSTTTNTIISEKGKQQDYQHISSPPIIKEEEEEDGEMEEQQQGGGGGDLDDISVRQKDEGFVPPINPQTQEETNNTTTINNINTSSRNFQTIEYIIEEEELGFDPTNTTVDKETHSITQFRRQYQDQRMEIDDGPSSPLQTTSLLNRTSSSSSSCMSVGDHSSAVSSLVSSCYVSGKKSPPHHHHHVSPSPELLDQPSIGSTSSPSFRSLPPPSPFIIHNEEKTNNNIKRSISMKNTFGVK